MLSVQIVPGVLVAGFADDQYTLSTFRPSERAKPGHAPVSAQTVLVSSHAPWTPIPQLIGWNAVGDGSSMTCRSRSSLTTRLFWTGSPVGAGRTG